MNIYQRGGTFLGIVIGLLVGLGAALAVAIYVTKVPVPFTNKGATLKSTPVQEAAEAQKNKGWDPNAPLYGKPPAKPAASGAVGATSTTSTDSPAATPVAAKPAAAASKATTSAASSADPIGDLARAKSEASSTGTADPFAYFVQVGAYSSQQDAQAQRAKLSMAGFEAKVTEREQSGRTVFRVRIGPIDKRDAADKTKEALDKNGFETAIVRIQR